MDVMCGGQAVEHRPPQAAEPDHAAVDAAVVHRYVDHAVPADAGGDRHEPSPAVDVVARREGGEHDRREPERVRIVQLEPAPAGRVMAAVDTDTGSVHDPAVHAIRDRLHRRERRDGDEERTHRLAR
jgi:hypothetical protein